VKAAAENGVSIRHIVEIICTPTSFSGIRNLPPARRQDFYGRAGAGAAFPPRRGERRFILAIGKAFIRVLETPGHTERASSGGHGHGEILVTWEVLTGDTLFIGDVGRPDL